MRPIPASFPAIVAGAAIAAVAGGMVWQSWQRVQAARPDYEQPSTQQAPRVVNGAEAMSVPNSEVWQVVSVTDGDTLEVQQGVRSERVRLCGIDAPEAARQGRLGQAGGEEAKAYLQQLVDRAQGRVAIVPVERDRYGRLVAEVFVLGETEEMAQTALLAAGMAYVYPQYVGDCWNGDRYGVAEAIAQEQRLGVWAEAGNVRPWEWRQQQ